MATTPAPLDAPKVVRIGRFQLTINVVVQVLVIVAIVAMANYLSLRHYHRFDWSRSQKFALGDQTKAVLSNLAKPVQAIVFFAGEGEAEADCRMLLREYEFTSKGKITVEEVNPFQNFTRARELQTRYKFGANENIVILDYDGKNKFINSSEMAEFEQMDQMAMMMGRRPQMTAFKGEQLLTNALLELTEAKQNKIYLLGGHGEYDFASDETKVIREQLSRQNIKVEALTLSNLASIPEDANAIAILGPRFDFSERDLKLLTDYWDKKGRLFVAVGTAGKRPGLDRWLADRGVQPAGDTVLRVVNLGGITGIMELAGIIGKGSPVTKNLETAEGTLIGQTQSLKIDRTKETTAQLRITELMSAPEGYWGETEYTGDRKTVPLFDPTKDNAAPLTLAVSVEKGASRDPSVKLETTRMLVFGNADLVSDEGLQAGPVFLDLATNAFNWLLSRETLIAIPAKPKQNIRISLQPAQMFSIAKWVTLYIPVFVGLFGLFYLWARHGKSLLKLTSAVAFIFVFLWGLWRSMLWYLGTDEGRRPSVNSLIVISAAVVIGTLALVVSNTRKKAPAPQS
jgi:hypothetical protein